MTTASDVQGWMEAGGAVIAALGTVAAFWATFQSSKVQQEGLAAERRARIDDERARIESMKASRRRLLNYALGDLVAAIRVVEDDQWTILPIRRENIEAAHRLVVEHARPWLGPMLNLREGLDRFDAWRLNMSGPQVRVKEHRDSIVRVLLNANELLENLLSAVDRAPASGPRWDDIPADPPEAREDQR